MLIVYGRGIPEVATVSVESKICREHLIVIVTVELLSIDAK